ncbi:N-acetylglucosamine-6-phosphate deacetylase [Hufsiella ginkgonis]|uniref:N-acetylglucosamine-6-phosphate deacetylase n=1 Tax=Hufsiella ginkgonis TaxID=2695274 RepID=A0A7K1XV59_9SPHI|nr:N-acetylglucosamine-6-phosphate deacetylase [Hufsiella ginkgonis]MXV14687.1 N-acetylglucosamine-6-phosphate deacetylase [Hufsiella ginkgonis]
MITLVNMVIISAGTEQRGMALQVKDGKIARIIPHNEVSDDETVIDLQGNFLAPGLTDLQVYGGGGELFGGTPSVEALAKMEDDLLNQGTTGFFATVATNSPEIVVRAIEAAKAYRPQAKGNFLGLHLEGPYLNAKRKGAHPAGFIKKATIEEIRNWVDLAGGEIRMVTLAPELQDREVLDYLDKQNIVISCGHSDATFEEALRFLTNAVPAVTHLYNAMPQMHHRQPGLIPAIFEKKPYTSIVADGIHVSFPMIRLAKTLLGEKLFLITDAVTATSKGIYPHVFTGDRYTMPDGTLSGSCLTMLKAVKNCVEQVNIGLAEAINMASLYPAQLSGWSTKGKIEAGYDADLLVFNDNFEVKGTYLSGIKAR